MILLWYFDGIAAVYELKQITAAVEVSLKQQNKYYSLLERRQQETDAHWHDIKKHVAVIRELMHMGESAIADGYIAEMESALSGMPWVVYTPHPIISAVLTHGLEESRGAGISVTMDIRLLQDIAIKPIDLCIILGNLFDNAIEACRLLPDGKERMIHIGIYQMNAALLIEMTNPYIPGDKGRRWKPHGLGLKNVAYVVEKYDGDLKRDIREGDYFVSIIFP